MPDYTMCEGKDCPLKDNCKRHIVKPAQMGQSYFMDTPYKDGKCDYYWPVKEADDLQHKS